MNTRSWCSTAVGMLVLAGCSVEGFILDGPAVVESDDSSGPGGGDPGGGNTSGDPGGGNSGDPGDGNTGGDPGGGNSGDPGGGDTPPHLPGSMTMAINTGLLGPGYGSQPFVDGVDFSAACHDEGVNIWNPVYLAELDPYVAIRFMNWGGTNNSSTRVWSDRKDPCDQSNIKTGWVDAGEDEPGMAYEWMVDLCNRTGKHMWINIPAETNADFHRQLATLIHDKLDPNLDVYVEYSNETWNDIFSQSAYCRNQGVALGLDSDSYKAGYEYHVYAAVRVFEIFEEVFAGESHRLVKIIAGFVTNSWVTEVHLAALEDPTINPNNVQIDAYAIAPYFGHSVNGAASNVVELLQDDIANAASRTEAIYNLVNAKGYPLFAYEGGQHVLANCEDINSSDQIYELYVDYFDRMKPYYSVFAYYDHTGISNSSGCWGALEFTGQPLAEAHKYRAIVDWVGDNQ